MGSDATVMGREFAPLLCAGRDRIASVPPTTGTCAEWPVRND